MTKSFFIIVPYSASKIFDKEGGSSPLSMLSGLTGGKKDEKKSNNKPKSDINVEAFEEARSQLEQRANVIKQGLARVGIRVAPLGTEEIIELYYKFFNPPETDTSLKV